MLAPQGMGLPHGLRRPSGSDCREPRPVSERRGGSYGIACMASTARRAHRRHPVKFGPRPTGAAQAFASGRCHDQAGSHGARRVGPDSPIPQGGTVAGGLVARPQSSSQTSRSARIQVSGRASGHCGPGSSPAMAATSGPAGCARRGAAQTDTYLLTTEIGKRITSGFCLFFQVWSPPAGGLPHGPSRTPALMSRTPQTRAMPATRVNCKTPGSRG